MSERERTFIRIDAHVSRLAALALVAAAMERYGTGVWHDIGRFGFVVIWAAIAAVVVLELAFAVHARRGVIRAILWLALVALANPLAPPLLEAIVRPDPSRPSAIVHLIAIDTRYIGEAACAARDPELIALVFRFMNSYMRATLNARELSKDFIWLTIGVSTLSPVPRT